MDAVLSLHELHEGIEVVGGGDQLREGDVKGAGLVDTATNKRRQ